MTRTLYVDRLPGLTTAYQYSVPLDFSKSTEDTTSAPAEPSETSISANSSVYYYNAYRDYGAGNVYGFVINPDASKTQVEASLYFRVQTNASSRPIAAIEVYEYLGGWSIVPTSKAIVQTQNTNARASLRPKAIVFPTKKMWRPRFWNTTGDVIGMMDVSVIINEFTK